MSFVEENVQELQYKEPVFGGVTRYKCPASDPEHSKYLCNYEMYKYHVLNCRNLK